MKIFLLGLPGSGKTTLGKQLASALKIQFVDLDMEVEKVEGKLIREIFREAGEDYFRTVEAGELKNWCEASKSFVMATGGGTPCFFNNMEIINRAGVSLFLDVPPAEIVKRVEKTRVEDRPLLGAGGREGLTDRIDFMRSNRISFYRQARHVISGSQPDLKEILRVVRT